MSDIRTKFLTAAALVGALTVGACDIDQTRDGEMPDVDVDVRGGQLPQYDVDGPDVDVSTTEDTIVVKRPKVDVKLPDDTLGTGDTPRR